MVDFADVPEVCLPKNVLNILFFCTKPEDAYEVIQAVLKKMDGETNSFDCLEKTNKFIAQQLWKTVEKRAKGYLNRGSNFRQDNPKTKKSIEA